MTYRILLSACLLLATSAAHAITTGQFEVRVYNGTGFDSTYLTLADGQLIVKSGGSPTALTLNKAAVGLGNVENTALSTWQGSDSINTVGELFGTLTLSSGGGAAHLAVTGVTWDNVGDSGFNVTLSPDTPTASVTCHLPASGGTLVANGVYDFFKLNAYTSDNIAPTDVGMGWADGKFTLQAPGGALQLYETGDPAEATLYFSGRITVESLEATVITGSISGDQVDNGSIPPGVMASSMVTPMAMWMDSVECAGAHGLTYANTGPLSTSQPTTVGSYFATIDVINGAGLVRNSLQGTIRTHAEMGVLQVVAAPSTASSTGTAGQIAYDASYIYFCTGTNTWKRVAIATW